MWYLVVLAAAASYLLGNLNGAVIVSSVYSHDDVRTHGSGNAGLTNFIRNYGASRSLLVILIDVLKAILACLLGGLMFPEYAIAGRTLGGVCVMLGHDFPALQGFRGGKGILSGWFIAWCIDWRVGLLVGIVFFCVYLLTKYVSLSSVLAAAAFGAGFVIFHRNDALILCGGIFMSLLTIFQHRSNILRLIQGNERKTDLFKKG